VLDRSQEFHEIDEEIANKWPSSKTEALASIQHLLMATMRKESNKKGCFI